MNQSPGGGFFKQKWLWALLALFMVMVAGVGTLAVVLLVRNSRTAQLSVSGESQQATRPSVVQSLFGGGITPVNLAAYYDKSASWNGANAWEVVPHGPATLGGVPFNVDGLLRLNGSSSGARSYREKIEGIEVRKKFGRLHLLHLTGATASADTTYARVVLHHADGTTSSLPLVYGQHARYWHRARFEFPSALSDPNSKVVWRGTHESTEKTLRLFKTTLANPKPEQEVTTIDLLSENVAANAVILAMSIGPAHLPAPKDDPPSLPEPEEPFEGEVKVTAVEAASGKPAANVRLKVSGSESGGAFRAPDVVTDANGRGTVRHAGDTTRSLTVVASGDGLAMQTVRWTQRTGDEIPDEYTLKMAKGVTIGGLIQDESGKPVRNVTLSLQGLSSPGDPNSRDRLPFTDASLTNDDQGRWEFRSLPEGFGEFNIVLRHPDYLEGRYLSDGVDRAYGGERVKLATLLKTEAVFSLRKGLMVTGRVLTEQGAPLSGAKVLLGDSRFESRPNVTRTDDRGAFRVTGGRPGGTYLTVQASGYAPQMQRVIIETNLAPLEFKLGPGHVFKARVVDEFGTPVRDARVTVDTWQSRQTVDLKGTTDSRGRVTIDSMPEDGMSGSLYKNGYMNMNGLTFPVDGEEVTLTIRRAVTVTGNVVDAATKEAIPRFDVTRGQKLGADQLYWQTYNMIKGSNGLFSLRLDQQGVTALQIESDDYLPSIVALGTNGETHFDVELKKGSGPKGIVLAPDGQPAAGAQLAVTVRGRMVNIRGGKLSSYDNETKIATADSKGAFTLRIPSNGEKILATHAKGFLETSYSNFVSGSTLTLQSWGSIQGTLKIGPRLGTNQTVLLTSDDNVQFSFEDFRTTTDETGAFSIPHVPPGERRLVRLISVGEGAWGHSHMQSIVVKAGEVTTVTMGGNGRAVIGKLTLSDPSRKIDWPQSGHHYLSFFPKPPPYKSMEEYRAWEASPEAVAARKMVRSYTLEMQEDGTFRVDDVLAGKYDLQVRLTESRGRDPGRGFANVIGTLATNVAIPEIPDAPAAPPLDLGTFVVPVTSGPRRDALLR